jgi:cell division septal protein FtsQ
MAQPARIPPAVEEPPLVDPAEIERAYRHHRARRHARLQRRRETQLARFRFWFVVAALVIAIAVVGVTVWLEIERLFGL